jgi:hypothetical protein
MALGIDDVVEDIGIPIVLAGLGIVIAAPFLLTASRPLTKKAVHACLAARDKFNEATAETQERWADLLAEVKAERDAAAAAKLAGQAAQA